MEGAAKEENFEQALKLAQELGPKADAYKKSFEELEKHKQEYEKAIEPLKKQIDGVTQAPENKRTPAHTDAVKANEQMNAAVQKGDYNEANKLVADMKSKVGEVLKVGFKLHLEITLPGLKIPVSGGKFEIVLAWQIHFQAQINQGEEELKLYGDLSKLNETKFGGEWGHTWWTTEGKDNATPLGEVVAEAKTGVGKDNKGTNKSAAIGIKTKIGDFDIGVAMEGVTPAAKVAYVCTKVTIPVKDRSFTFEGRTVQMTKIQVQPVGGTASIAPDYAKIIAQYAAEKGVDIGVSGVAAGGTGAAGAAAVAAAPAAGIAGGILGGLALTAGAMAWIDSMKEAGKEAAAICQEGARKCRDYAASYGSAMRGKPGPNAQGNQDAERALQVIMQKVPGTTREQAIEAAKQSKHNYEQLAFRALLPSMRAQVEKAYSHSFNPGFSACLKEYLGDNTNY